MRRAWVVMSRTKPHGPWQAVAVYLSVAAARLDYPNEALYPISGPFELRG